MENRLLLNLIGKYYDSFSDKDLLYYIKIKTLKAIDIIKAF